MLSDERIIGDGGAISKRRTETVDQSEYFLLKAPFDVVDKRIVRLVTLLVYVVMAEGHTTAEKNPVVSVSSIFFPGSRRIISDTVLRSSDSVLFYVNSALLLRTSPRVLNHILPGTSLQDNRFREDIIDIPDSSAVLNVILHVFHNLPGLLNHLPSLDILETAVGRMHMYGLVPSECITPSTPLFDALLSYAPIDPIRLYTLAGEHSLSALAEQTSSHLLSFNLADISDDLAKRMGAKYLRRLMALHLTRLEELKRIILRPPTPHVPTRECHVLDQKNLSRAWPLAASYLAWDSSPDLSVQTIQSTFSSLRNHLTCHECIKVLQHRVKEVGIQWSNVKRTI